MPETILSLDAIDSKARYVVHGREGVISEHKTATDAVQSLLLRTEDFPLSDVGVYRRDSNGWTLL